MARVDDLTMLRSKLIEEIAGADGKDVASLSRELRMVLTELDDLNSGAEVSVVDDLARKRQARRADAQGGEVPAVGDDCG